MLRRIKTGEIANFKEALTHCSWIFDEDSLFDVLLSLIVISFPAIPIEEYKRTPYQISEEVFKAYLAITCLSKASKITNALPKYETRSDN